MERSKDFDNQKASSEDLSQEVTESYGTGAYPEPGMNIGDRKLREEIRNNNQANPVLTGGDVDAAWEEAADVGDEAVGGTAPTPDQDIVEENANAVGIEINDRAFLRTNDMLEQRDDRRWELDPKSSEDYTERRESE